MYILLCITLLLINILCHIEYIIICVCCVLLLSRVRLFVTTWTVAHQAPLFMGFSRHEYWSGLPCPPPGELPIPGIDPRSPTLQMDSLPSEPLIMIEGKQTNKVILTSVLHQNKWIKDLHRKMKPLVYKEKYK